MKIFALSLAFLACSAPRRRAAAPRRRRGKRLWRYRAPDRRRRRRGDQHPHQPRAGPASVRGEPADRAGARRRRRRDRQRRRLRRLDGEAGRRRLSAGPARDLGRRDLVGAKPGDNPHLWYAPANAKAAAHALPQSFAAADPAGAADYAAGEAAFVASMRPLDETFAAHAKQVSRAHPSPRPSRCSATRPKPWGSTCASRNSRSR